MYLGWFSCGITSAVACKMAIDKFGKDNVRLFYLVIDTAHQDNERFLADCEQWYGIEIERRRSPKYKDHFEVIEGERYINGAGGAHCTKELKKNVRYRIEKEFDFEGQIFGFEFEKGEINRAIRFAQQYPHTKPEFPLIDREMTKAQCAELLLKNGIRLPEMYKLGFHNNNCIGCVKGGAGYWNKIKEHFPDNFDKMANLERKLGHTCIKGKYLDEISPGEGRHEGPIVPNCGTFCEVEFADLIDPNTEQVLFGIKTMKQLTIF